MADFPMEFVLQVRNEMSAGISQATSDIKGLGDQAQQTQTKAKSSGMGIGAAFQFTALNAFNLAHSLIETKRSYEDLDKAENAQRNKRDAVTKATNRLENAEITLAAARKKGDPARIAKAENNLANAKLNVSRVTRAEQLGQVELNRAHEDFYLNIIPNVISGLGTIFGLFQVMQGAGGIGGLISAFKKLFIPMAVISGIALAIKTNFLGFRDFLTGLGKSIGDAVPALKPFLNILQEVGELLGLLPAKKDTKAGGGLNKAIADLKAQFGPVIDFFKNIIDDVMKGDWSGAFKRITDAAAEAWKQMKIAFPLFGEIESLVNKLKNGQWKGAFLQIWKAATDVWNTIKIAVPIFGKIETIVNDIKAGKWGEAFQKVADVAKQIFTATLGKGIEFMFGKNWISELDAFLKLQESEASLNKRPLILQYLVTINGAIKDITGIDVGKWFTDHPITTKIPIFGGITMMIDDPAFRASLVTGGTIIVNALGKAITDAATFLDPYIAGLINSIDFSGKDVIASFTATAQKFVTGLSTGISQAVSTSPDWGKLITDLVVAIGNSATAKAIEAAMKESPLGQLISGGIIKSIIAFFTPESMGQVVHALVNSILNILKSVVKDFENIGIRIANSIITAIGKFFTPESVGKIIHTLVNAISNLINSVGQDFINIGTRIGNKIGQGVTQALRSVLNSLPFMPGSALDNARKQLNNQRATGFHGLVTGATTFTAGERGAEQVDITTRADMMTQKKPSGGGPSTIIVYSVLDGRVVAESVARQISINQAVYR